MRRLFMLIIALFFLSGCASIMSGRMQKITVQADPPGASILIDGGVNTSPCQQEVKRSEKHNIVAEKPGYKPCQFTPDRTMNPWVIGNILIGGIIGIIIDAASGSIVAIDQDEVRMVLYQGKDCDIFVKSRDQWVNVNKTDNKEEVKTAGYRATGVQSISYTESREVKTTVADNTKIPESNISEAKKQSLEINNDTETSIRR